MPGVIIGLRDLHYALLQQDDSSGVVYSTPVKIAGAVQANINPNSSNDTLFADDGPMETASSLGQIELELIAADFPLEVQAALLGHTISGGVLKRNANDVPPWVAIGFKSLKSNGKYRYVWLLKGKFNQPEQKHETKGDRVNFQTPTLKGNFVKRDYDNEWIHQTDEDMINYVASLGANWFTAVSGGVATDTTPPAVSSSTPVDGATGVAVSTALSVTFNEALALSTINAGSVFLLNATDANIAGTINVSADRKTITFTPASNLAATTAYRLIFTTAITDLAGNKLAAPYVLNFTTA